MKINLIDPGLISKKGHHHDLDLRIINQLISQNHEVILYSHKDYVTNDDKDHIKVIPLFSINPYDNFKEDPFTGELDEFIYLSNIYSQELNQIGNADLILAPTLFSFLLNALALLKSKKPIAGCVHFGPDFQNINNGKLRWRVAFRNAADNNLSLNIGGLEKVTVHDYLPITMNKKFHLFPLPYDGSPIVRKKTELKTIGFFGHQRGEKGFKLFEPLIKYLINEKKNIIFHDSGCSLSFNHPMVRNINFVKDISVEIAKCDLVLLPYSHDEYKNKGSGILWESLATGIPTIVPSDCTLAEHIKDTGAGITFSDSKNIESIFDAFKRAELTFEHIAQNSFIASQNWRKTHGIKNFITDFLNTNHFYH